MQLLLKCLINATIVMLFVLAIPFLLALFVVRVVFGLIAVGAAAEDQDSGPRLEPGFGKNGRPVNWPGGPHD